MALLLVYLHGKEEAALSNQMRQTKSMSPRYAIKWWAERGLSPPNIDPVRFIKKRLPWRYAKGTPLTDDAYMYLGDSLRVLPRLRSRVLDGQLSRARLLFTSPPYYAVTNYHYDQWLRLWLLGGPPHALRLGASSRGRFEHQEDYRNLLHGVFTESAKLLHKNATVYVRTDRREYTYKTTLSVLREVFATKHLVRRYRPLDGPTQTRLFGGASRKEGEVDLILRPR